MSVKVERIINFLEELAPLIFALPEDPVGLQLGDPQAEIDHILVALDLDEHSLTEALSLSAGMVVTHHPLIYQPLRAVNESSPHSALIARAIRNRLNVYSAHTNLDIAPQGLGSRLADLLELAPGGRKVIEITGREALLKLVVFVPMGHEDTVRSALAAAGAGWIGGYSHCTFQGKGTGTFMPREGTNPFMGSTGRLEMVEELRLETILPASRRRQVVEALLKAHPYEEVAYDLIPLENEGEPYGLGVIGAREHPCSLHELLQLCREKLKLAGLRYLAPRKESFTKIALCPGSGGSLIEKAASLGAEIYISGDFRYHDFLKAQSLGLGLIDAGHYGTEAPAVELLVSYLRQKLAGESLTAKVTAAAPAVDWHYD